MKSELIVQESEESRASAQEDLERDEPELAKAKEIIKESTLTESEDEDTGGDD